MQIVNALEGEGSRRGTDIFKTSFSFKSPVVSADEISEMLSCDLV